MVPHDLKSAFIRSLLLQGKKTTVHTDIGSEPSVANSKIILMNEGDPNGETIVSVYPNPSTSYFTINIETLNSKDKISIRLIDVTGRVVEMKNNLTGNQTLRMGNNLKTGLYFAEIIQGRDRKQLKLLRQE
jgi:hypothetical protein